MGTNTYIYPTIESVTTVSGALLANCPVNLLQVLFFDTVDKNNHTEYFYQIRFYFGGETIHVWNFFSKSEFNKNLEQLRSKTAWLRT